MVFLSMPGETQTAQLEVFAVRHGELQYVEAVVLFRAIASW